VGFTSRPGWWCGDERGCNLRHCCRHGNQCITVCPDENPSGIPMTGGAYEYPLPAGSSSGEPTPAPVPPAVRPVPTTPVPPAPSVEPATPTPTPVQPLPLNSATSYQYPGQPGQVPQHTAAPGMAPNVISRADGSAPRDAVAPAIYQPTTPANVGHAIYERQMK
jgi:hypothetical protein